MMRTPPYLATLALAAPLAALLAACGDNAALLTTTDLRGVASSNVTVSRAATGLRLTNVGTAPLGFAVFERTHYSLIFWAPCADPGPSCVRLPAGATVTVPFSEIGGYSSGAREVVVNTWRVVPNPAGGHRAVDLASLVVRL